MPAAYHHGDLRRALVGVATRQLEEKGPAALSLRAVARALGVSPAAPYAHFPDKETLLAAVAADGFAVLGDACAAAAAAPDPMPALGRTYVGFARAHPGLYRLMFGGVIADLSSHPELEAAAHGAFGRLRASLEGNSDAASAAWAFVHGLSMLLLDGRLRPDDGDVDGLVDRLLATFAAGRRQSPSPGAGLGL